MLESVPGTLNNSTINRLDRKYCLGFIWNAFGRLVSVNYKYCF